MQFGKIALFTACVLGAAIPSVAANHPKKPAPKRAAKPAFASQRGIDDQRATELQAALIKSGYLSGTPSGHWDTTTEAAMTKLQADNGWQTKLVPDSRAIIKLGLGPAADTMATGTVPAPSGE